MDLFAGPARPDIPLKDRPLAARMAPRDWPQYVGQAHLVGQGGLLRRLIEADRLGSAIFFGPPGTGKTALARLTAFKTRAHVEETNAVNIGVPDIRKLLLAARDRRKVQNIRTLLVLDEIHHFNRTQQDALLPDVEKGVVHLIGLTTENPFFYVNAALISRSTVFEFKPLMANELKTVIKMALEDNENGFGGQKVRLAPEAEAHLLRITEGDARRLLNALELAVLTTPSGPDGVINIDLKAAEGSTQRRAMHYDKGGDNHYDTISAFIKSLRGSDPDAALYWMSKMLVSGEDPRFVARRLLVAASEDVGNADPNALVIANAAFEAVDKLGMPEGRIPLAQATVYVACAPKSNAAYLAGDAAAAEVENGPRREVPNHLKDSNRDGEKLGHGDGYQYPHDFPGHFVKQDYMPKPKKFYEPSEVGLEKKIKDKLDLLWPERRKK